MAQERACSDRPNCLVCTFRPSERDWLSGLAKVSGPGKLGRGRGKRESGPGDSAQSNKEDLKAFLNYRTGNKEKCSLENG